MNAVPASGVDALLRMEELECIRDGRALFTGLTTTLYAGELLSLQGANGAGKSTLLRALAGLYPDYSGTLHTSAFVYSGHKVGVSGHLSTRENLQFLVGLSSQGEGELLDDAQTARALTIEPLANDFSAALADVGLAGYDDVRCSALSAGQLRRVGLARLLLAREPLWLLDEPLTALDPAGAQLLGRVLDRHTQAGGAAVCATHQDLPATTHRTLLLTSAGVPEIVG